MALVEMALRADTGARCRVPDGMDPFVLLFSESASRAVVVVPPDHEARLLEVCADHGLPAMSIGVVDSGAGSEVGHPSGTQVFLLEGQFTVTLDELREVHERTIPAALSA
jgi:phosphoribosylformylglycinamidine synthase